MSKPRREVKHFLTFSTDLRKFAAGTTRNNIDNLLVIRPAAGAKKTGRARAGEALKWSPKTDTKTAIYSDLGELRTHRKDYYWYLLGIGIEVVNIRLIAPLYLQ